MASNLRHLLSCGTIAVGVILEFSHKPGSMEYILFSQEVISGKELRDKFEIFLQQYVTVADTWILSEIKGCP